jgi:hypothetical protein
MENAQEWCLQCGTAVPGSLATHSGSWRASALVLGATAILVLGAATAAVAALTKTNSTARKVAVIVAQAPPAAPVTPTTVPPATTATPPATNPAATPVPPAATVKPPKIPLTVPTPKVTPTTPKVKVPVTPTTPTTSTPNKTSTTPSGKASEPQPTTTAILLDTNAVTSYNPENYPPATFGDPSLTTDGDTSTGWTALVDPALAPKMAVGLLIDLNTPQKLSFLEMVTSTPGMTVQVFGANGSTAPTTITNPAWTHLSALALQKKRHTLIKLSEPTKAFRFVTLWISGAPPASIGTPTAPGRVSVNEIEVFPTK